MGRNLCGRHLRTREKRGEAIGLTKRGKGTKVMILTEGNGVPVAALAADASLGEPALLEPLLEQRVIRRRPQRLIYDRALDSDEHRRRLQRLGIELICPHRKNRVRARLQDGRSLRRYRRRWKMERSNGWQHNFRRFALRHDWYLLMFTGFVQLACLKTILNRF